MTHVIVFIFFRPSGKQDNTVSTPVTDSVQVFEKRIAHIETILAEKLGSGAEFDDGNTDSTSLKEGITSIEAYKQRVERVETAFTVKFDSLAERLDRLEKQIALLNQKAVAPATQASLPVKAAPPVKTATASKAKPAVKAPEPMLHTVEKGETLYSISRKYDTTVAQLRKLNKLSEKDDIYPGNNILVR